MGIIFFFFTSSRYFIDFGSLPIPQTQNFWSPQRQILPLDDAGSPAQPHCGFAGATELCIFPNVTHKHVILQTFCSRCSNRREHSLWAWNHRVRYFPLVKHASKVVTSSIQPKLQHKLQAPSHTGPVYSRTEAWIHPSCHCEDTLTPKCTHSKGQSPLKTEGGQSISQTEELIIPREQGLQPETCKHTFSHQKANGGMVSEKEKTSQWTNRYLHPPLWAHLHTPMTSPGGGGKKQHP